MGVLIKVWKKNKKRRLYVVDEDSKTTVGWIDPDTHTGSIEDPARAVEYIAILSRYGIPQEVTIGILAAAQKRRNVDLASNRPGEAAMQKAEELTKGMSKAHADIVRSLGYGSVDQTWIQGAEGERLVGNMLETNLPDTWKVLHSVPIGGEHADIDHLIIGNNGVFSVNTKNHPGSKVTCAENKVNVQGQSISKYQPYAQKSRAEARRTSEILMRACHLDIPVMGVLAFIALELNIMSNPKDGKVVYLNADHLCSWLLNQPQTYSDRTVDVIFQKARWSETWRDKS